MESDRRLAAIRQCDELLRRIEVLTNQRDDAIEDRNTAEQSAVALEAQLTEAIKNDQRDAKGRLTKGQILRVIPLRETYT